MSQPIPAPPGQPPPNWWHRNWKWVVPAGCAGCLTAVVCFVGALMVFVFSMIKRSDVYTDAVAQARSNPAVIQELGEPIETGWWVSGSISTTGPSGTADFSAPLRGSSARGTLYVTAEKKAGVWHYQVLEVAPEGTSSRIDLLTDGNSL
jgi:hypothetical protein